MDSDYSLEIDEHVSSEDEHECFQSDIITGYGDYVLSEIDTVIGDLMEAIIELENWIAFNWCHQRIIWIGKFKNKQNSDCYLNRLPVYVIWYLFTFGNPKFEMQFRLYYLSRQRIRNVEILESRYDIIETTYTMEQLAIDKTPRGKKRRKRGKKKNKNQDDNKPK